MGMYWNSPSFVKHAINRDRYGFDDRKQSYKYDDKPAAPTIVINVPQSVAQDVKREDEATREIVGQAATAMNELASALNRLLKG